MPTIREKTRVILRNILYLTDFSQPSEVALPFAVGLARTYGARVHALHVLTPVIPQGCAEAIEADVRMADSEMERVKEQLSSIDYDATNVTGMGLWPAVDQAITNQGIDLIVLGTHGRTHARRLLLGSFAEEIFRRSSIPVLTIGPDVPKHVTDAGTFGSILFATDFGKPCEAASPFAVSLAEEYNARLVLLHVVPEANRQEVTAAELELRLYSVVPTDARVWCQPFAVVRYGEPADGILEAAADNKADVIVLGVRGADHLGAATHLERAIAHKVVAHARCPVLTVRG
jgi:nucleotide-binding universal stress UspA family protein